MLLIETAMTEATTIYIYMLVYAAVNISWRRTCGYLSYSYTELNAIKRGITWRGNAPTKERKSQQDRSTVKAACHPA